MKKTKQVRISRGLMIGRNEWAFGDQVGKDRIAVNNWKSNDNYWITGQLLMVAPETMGDFIGLFAEDGERIYEGDIISHIGERIGVVKYYPEIAAYGFTNNPGSTSEEDAWFFYDCEPSIYGILGNIYENPELLEMGEKEVKDRENRLVADKYMDLSRNLHNSGTGFDFTGIYRRGELNPFLVYDYLIDIFPGHADVCWEDLDFVGSEKELMEKIRDHRISKFGDREDLLRLSEILFEPSSMRRVMDKLGIEMVERIFYIVSIRLRKPGFRLGGLMAFIGDLMEPGVNVEFQID